MKYRTKSFDIEAERFDGENFGVIQAFVGKREAPGSPGYYIENFDDAREYLVDPASGIVAVVWEGVHKTWLGVRVGDYIIRGMEGNFYPCHPETFLSRYEPVTGVVTSQMFTERIQQSRRFRVE